MNTESPTNQSRPLLEIALLNFVMAAAVLGETYLGFHMRPDAASVVVFGVVGGTSLIASGIEFSRHQPHFCRAMAMSFIGVLIGFCLYLELFH